MFGKEENLKRALQCRSFILWALLLVTMLGLCVLWTPFSAAAQSSGHCPVYVEKLDNIHSLADRATNELGRAFAEKLAEMYTLADQSCQAHKKGNAYFEEGSPRADLKYQQALNLDKQILGKIGAIVPTFGVTAELKAKLEEAHASVPGLAIQHQDLAGSSGSLGLGCGGKSVPPEWPLPRGYYPGGLPASKWSGADPLEMPLGTGNLFRLLTLRAR